MSSGSLASLLEIGLFYGFVLAIAIWQVVKMRRMLAKDRRDRLDNAKADQTEKVSKNIDN